MRSSIGDQAGLLPSATAWASLPSTRATTSSVRFGVADAATNATRVPSGDQVGRVPYTAGPRLRRSEPSSRSTTSCAPSSPGGFAITAATCDQSGENAYVELAGSQGI